MPVLRQHHGAVPSHPVFVVPDDATRRGALVRVRGWEVAVADPVADVRDGQALAAAADAVGWDRPERPDGPPFTSGLLGFITDDVSAALMDLQGADDRPVPAALVPLWFGEYTHAVCQAPDGSWWLCGRDEDAVEQAAALLAASTRDRSDDGPTPGPPEAGEPEGEAWTTMTRAEHAHAVGQVKEWIAAGDVYQVNLTMHVSAGWSGTPRTLARRLFGASNDAAHAALLHTPGGTIASVSPETFLRMDGRQATVRPIKGTRRRYPDGERDRAMADDLRSAGKDRAEHVMIVDLERNDLGRVCEVGSVRVPELMALEAHPTVWHLTSTVTGTVRPEADLRQVLRALFPCGSVTGAPKRMAVDRIRRLEPWRRGVYCGAIGVVAEGLVDLSVAIRTAVLHEGRAWYGTGGGIVADSQADAEWDEAMDKAAAFFTATGTRPPE